MFAQGTTHYRVLEIARILRNTVHGEGLHTTAAKQGGRPRETLVALPEDDAQDLADLFGHLGGLDEWGLRNLRRRGRTSNRRA